MKPIVPKEPIFHGTLLRACTSLLYKRDLWSRFFSLYICGMKIKVYDAYEALYIKEAMRMEEKVTSTYDLWVEKEVTEEELLSLARRGEKIMINV